MYMRILDLNPAFICFYFLEAIHESLDIKDVLEQFPQTSSGFHRLGLIFLDNMLVAWFYTCEINKYGEVIDRIPASHSWWELDTLSFYRYSQ